MADPNADRLHSAKRCFQNTADVTLSQLMISGLRRITGPPRSPGTECIIIDPIEPESVSN